MPHSKRNIDHRDRRADVRQNHSRRLRGSLARLGKRNALLVGLLALSVLTVFWLGGAPIAWGASPVSPVMGIASGDATSGSFFWARIREAFSWQSPLLWFLIGLPAFGLLSWGLLWGVSRFETANRDDQEMIEE